MGTTLTSLQEGLSGIRVVQAFAQEPSSTGRFGRRGQCDYACANERLVAFELGAELDARERELHAALVAAVRAAPRGDDWEQAIEARGVVPEVVYVEYRPLGGRTLDAGTIVLAHDTTGEVGANAVAMFAIAQPVQTHS